MKSWFKRHLQVFFYTLGQFTQNSLSVSMTLLALGIGFSIPVVMYNLVDSLSNIGGQWQERPQITLYLEKQLADEKIQSLKVELASDSRFDSVEYISAEQGLAEFSKLNQFDQAIELLDDNPLPDVFVVYPSNADDPNKIAELSAELNSLAGVSSAQYDFQWLQKLSALSAFLKRAIVVLASIISIGIMLLIANTIRLEISIRKDEIDIIDQLGGSPPFIARPFLYLGFLQGLLGGVAAVLISAIVIKLLAIPLLKLARLYDIGLEIVPARLDIALVVLAISGLLGWLSAKVTVRRYMQGLRPQ